VPITCVFNELSSKFALQKTTKKKGNRNSLKQVLTFSSTPQTGLDHAELLKQVFVENGDSEGENGGVLEDEVWLEHGPEDQESRHTNGDGDDNDPEESRHT
jgi:hypothetical protein